MKKCMLFFIAGVFLIGTFVFFTRKTEVKYFDVGEYMYYIDAYSSELVFGKALTADDAVEIAKTVWNNTYSYEIYSDKQYTVCYDEVRRVWLIGCDSNSLQFEDGFSIHMGGGPHILIAQDNGQVLAVWHDR